MIRYILAFIWFWSAMPAMAQESITAAAVRLPKGATLCGEAVPLVLDDVRERFEREMLLALGNRPQVLLWLKRSTRYFPYIAQELKKAGMPDDLKYLAVVESALRPHAGSSRGAIGFWQLMPETARKNGLTVNDHIDQRRDLFLSTPAALGYLKMLYARFGTWSLALAAYNMGEEGLDAEMLEQKTRDFYQLYLSLETQRFLLRILTVKLILGDPKDYGFELAADDYYQPLKFDSVTLDCFNESPLRLVADAANTSFKVIKDLNPHLRGHYIQAGHYELRVPPGSAGGFQERFRKLAQDHDHERVLRLYVVQSGDTLSTIAEKFNVPLAALLIWNRINPDKMLFPGTRLVIYPRDEEPSD